MIAVRKGLVIDGPWMGFTLSAQESWEMRPKSTSHRDWFGPIQKKGAL